MKNAEDQHFMTKRAQPSKPRFNLRRKARKENVRNPFSGKSKGLAKSREAGLSQQSSQPWANGKPLRADY